MKNSNHHLPTYLVESALSAAYMSISEIQMNIDLSFYIEVIDDSQSRAYSYTNPPMISIVV